MIYWVLQWRAASVVYVVGLFGHDSTCLDQAQMLAFFAGIAIAWRLASLKALGSKLVIFLNWYVCEAATDASS